MAQTKALLHRRLLDVGAMTKVGSKVALRRLNKCVRAIPQKMNFL